MNIILFDNQITGHHSEYIDHIVTYLSKKTSINTYYFVVHHEFENRFESIVAKSKGATHIRWEFLTPEEIESLTNLSMLRSSFVSYRLVQKYAKDLKADQVHLLYFNNFQLAIAFKRPKFKVSGILFQQFSRMSKESWKDQLKYFRKYYITKLYSKNRQLESIFILNDHNTAKTFNQKFKTGIFKTLPDPIPNLQPLSGFSVYDSYSILKEKKIILHFGSLADRKGTFEFVMAVKFIPKEIQNTYAFLLVGKAENIETEVRIKEMINEMSKASEVQIALDNTFVSNAKMRSLFEQSYAVAIPYKNPEASSGILGHAIATKKPVITTGKGLLRQLVEENNFGLLLDTVTPEKIAEAITKVNRITNTNNIHYNRYIEGHTTKEFSQTLLK